MIKDKETRASVALAAIKRAAEAGEPCPSNLQLARLIGAESMSAGANVVSFLAATGVISVERGSSNRVVTVHSIGKSTAGRVKAPHWSARDVRPDLKAASAAKEAVFEQDSELLDEIEVEAIRTGTPMAAMLTRLLWLGLNCHIDDVLAERGAA